MTRIAKVTQPRFVVQREQGGRFEDLAAHSISVILPSGSLILSIVGGALVVSDRSLAWQGNSGIQIEPVNHKAVAVRPRKAR